MKRTVFLILTALVAASCTVPIATTTTIEAPPTAPNTPIMVTTTTTQGPTSTTSGVTTTLPAKDDVPLEATGPLAGEWIRIYASLEASTTTEQAATAVSETIPGAKVLLSDDYPSLNPGYWVVYDGGFDDKYSADLCPIDLPPDATCYPRWIGDPIIAEGSAIALIAGELMELTPGADARPVGDLTQEASWVYNLELTGTRDGVIFAEGTEDFWLTCESSAGAVYFFDLKSQQRTLLGSGIAPVISPDGTRVAWLHSSTCIDDPSVDGWVLTPADTLMVSDLDGTNAHTVGMNVPLEGPFDPRELTQLVWIDNETLLVSDFESSFYRVPTQDETFGGDPMLDGIVGAILGYGTDGLLVLDNNGGEGDAFEWWLLGIDLDTASADFLMTGPDYITVGTNSQGEIIIAIEDTYWPRGEEPFKAPGYIEAIDW